MPSTPRFKKVVISLIFLGMIPTLHAEDEILFEKSNGDTVRVDVNNNNRGADQFYSTQGVKTPELNITPSVGGNILLTQPNPESDGSGGEVLFVQDNDNQAPENIEPRKPKVDSWMMLVQSTNKDYSAIEQALQNGQNINKGIWEGNNMLLLGAQQNNIQEVKFALEHKANVHATNNDGETALHWAAYNGNINMINLLLNTDGKDPKQDLNKQSKTGRTPLHMAALNKNTTEAIKILLIQGADPNIMDKNKQTPAHYAAALRYWDNLEVFVKRGISMTQKDANDLSIDDMLLNHADIQGMIKFFYYVTPSTQKVFDDKLTGYPDKPKING